MDRFRPAPILRVHEYITLNLPHMDHSLELLSQRSTAAAIILNARHGYHQDDRTQIANKVSVNVNADLLAELSKRLPN